MRNMTLNGQNMWLLRREIFLELLRNTYALLVWVCGTLCIAGAAAMLINVAFPAFTQELVLHMEQDAVHLANHVQHSFQLNPVELTQDDFTPETRNSLATMAKDLNLYKIRFYNAQGIIVYSTVAAEIGGQNTDAYFQQFLAKGKSISKLTRKNDSSMEGNMLLRDVVETYVPIMGDQKVIGAVELYADVTASYLSIERLASYLKTIIICLAFVLFCGLTLLLLARAKQELDARKHHLLTADLDQTLRHDLKGPLSTLIHGFDFLTQETSTSHEHYELLMELKKVAYRMLHAIISSLTLQKIERGGYVTSRESVDVAILLHNIQEDLSQLIQRKGLGIVIRQKNDQEHFSIHGDHALLYSILANLLKNAMEASGKNKDISVTLFSQPHSQHIAITNDGAVPPGIRESFFEKFVTADKPGGTGFGTYSAKMMTEIQGGSIRLECNDDTGTTTVYLSFPTHESN